MWSRSNALRLMNLFFSPREKRGKEHSWDAPAMSGEISGSNDELKERLNSFSFFCVLFCGNPLLDHVRMKYSPFCFVY